MQPNPTEGAGGAGGSDPAARDFEDSKAGSSRVWIWLLLLFAVPLVLVAVFYGEEDWRGARAWERFEKEQAALGVQAGPDFSHAIPAPVEDEENFAATPYWDYVFAQVRSSLVHYYGETNAYFQAKKALDKTGNNGLANMGWADGISLDAARWASSVELEEILGPKSASHPRLASTNTTGMAAGLLARLAPFDAVLDELREAAPRRRSRFKVNYAADNPYGILLPHYSNLLQASRGLRMRSAAELALGRADAAAADVDLGMRLAQAIDSESFIFSGQVSLTMVAPCLRTIWEGMDRHQWSEAQLRQFEQRLAPLDLPSLARASLEGERMMGNTLLDFLQNQPGKAAEVLNLQEMLNDGVPVAPPLLELIPSGWLAFERVNCNREMLHLERAGFEPEKATIRPKVVDEAAGRVKGWKAAMPAAFREHRLLAALLAPDTHAFLDRTAFAQTGVNLARVACALERYRLAKGEYPASLEALTPDWIKSVPRDIINGGPLHYLRSSGDAYRLYSVGWNERDDGGEIVYQTTGSVGTSKKHRVIDADRGDWVWAIPGVPEPMVAK